MEDIQIEPTTDSAGISRRSLIVGGTAIAFGVAFATLEASPARAADEVLGHCYS